MSAIRLNKYNGLDTDAAVRMFRYHAGNTPVSYEDAKEVTTMCGRNPLVIKVKFIMFSISIKSKLLINLFLPV